MYPFNRCGFPFNHSNEGFSKRYFSFLRRINHFSYFFIWLQSAIKMVVVTEHVFTLENLPYKIMWKQYKDPLKDWLPPFRDGNRNNGKLYTKLLFWIKRKMKAWLIRENHFLFFLLFIFFCWICWWIRYSGHNV